MFYFFKTPSFLQLLFPKYLWKISRDDKVIYLTFDDGPTSEVTEWTLETLKSFKAKATFFCEGQQVDKHTALVNKILSDGHSIGNHTYSHLNGWKTNTQTYLVDIEKARKTLLKVTKGTCEGLLFRPPYGKIKPIQANKLIQKGYKIVMLDVVSGDFDLNLKPEKCLKKLLKNTKSGSIVVFHDSEKAYKTLRYVLPQALDYWSKNGFRFLALK